MSKTLENLKNAFAGESQANRKYLAFAAKAEKEGHTQVAKLFRAAANAETIHAHKHLALMDGIGSTADNLKGAIGGETFEFTDMYPAMIADAKAEGNATAEAYFTLVNEAEKVHAALYTEALEKMDSLEDGDYYLCPVCGHTQLHAPKSNCPICGAAATAYFKSV